MTALRSPIVGSGFVGSATKGLGLRRRLVTARRGTRRSARRTIPGRTNARAIRQSDAASNSAASAFTSGVIPNFTCV